MFRPKVLIIDDEKDFCHFAKFNLESTRRYRVLTRTSGSEGLQTAIRKRPDIIYLDIMMPGMDGFEVLTALKENVRTANIPVVMLTALDQDVSKMKAAELYCDQYLAKPVGLEMMLHSIESLLGKQ